MHQKTSEFQIGKDSSGVSSDFNPIPTFSSPISDHPPPSPSSLVLVLPSPDDNNNKFNNFTTVTNANPNHQHEIVINDVDLDLNPISSPAPKSTPHKRPIFPQTTTNLSSNSPFSPEKHYSKRAVALHLLDRLRHLRRLQSHLRLILLLSLPFFYFLVSHPSQSYVLDFLAAFAFSAALLFSLNLGLPQLPSLRTLLARSFPIKLYSSTHSSRPPLPVFWSIGSKPKGNKKRVNSGCWVQAYSNGDVYEGEFHKGKCSGCGVYYYYMSGRYEGDWVDGMYDGYGVETWVKGSRYRGQYRQGLRHGLGVYMFYTGDVYSGEWSNGRSHGCGVHSCEDGSRYAGAFKWGVKHGLGYYHFRNGDTYAGEYFADKMHGFGVYNFANGHRYDGSWHEGRRQGFGVYTFRNGETQSGHWQNGVLDVPSSKNITSPVSTVVDYRAKVINAVQEARRAAEKAYDAPANMDQKVNNVVTSANWAANAARVAAIKAVQKQMHKRRNSDELPIPVVQNLHHLQTQLSI
ncbi:hypothetical protein L1887_37263 [Cichorium endivia]|nr:hypothetical protein L1887_37263 [Cichorium endivia]